MWVADDPARTAWAAQWDTGEHGDVEAVLVGQQGGMRLSGKRRHARTAGREAVVRVRVSLLRRVPRGVVDRLARLFDRLDAHDRIVLDELVEHGKQVTYAVSLLLTAVLGTKSTKPGRLVAGPGEK